MRMPRNNSLLFRASYLVPLHFHSASIGGNQEKALLCMDIPTYHPSLHGDVKVKVFTSKYFSFSRARNAIHLRPMNKIQLLIK